jgi:hypothetical protein
MVLRCHLGLHVPSQKQCWIQVGDEKQSWGEGKCLVFDDTFVHTAVNLSDLPRVILLLDFSTGVPLPEHLQSRHGNQRDYLDQITAKYGYGPDDNAEKQVVEESSGDGV